MMKKKILQFLMQLSIIAGMAYGTVTLVHYFFGGSSTQKDQESYQGQPFSAPLEKQVIMPINREINFMDLGRPAKEVLTPIDTVWGSLIFTSDGASLQRFEIKRELAGKDDKIATIVTENPEERETRCFLVAFDHETPYFYHLEKVVENESRAILTYKASLESGFITKIFTVHKDKYQIDVEIGLEKLHVHKPVQLRMIFPAPVMLDLKSPDIISGFVLEKDKIKQFDQKNIPMTTAWKRPTLFGANDRYFINALISDQQEKIESAYYWKAPEGRLLCCVQSVEIASDCDWKWSFYVGPKDTDDVQLVDPRLEYLVEYSGWFGPIAVILLKILKYLYKYFHNFGIAIIVLTLLMRLLMLPLAFNTETQRKKRADLDKKLKYLQQKYKDNPQRFNQEQLELIRKQGIGLGFLAAFINLPFFFALNRLLASSIELYKAPFVSGWISDLSAPDPYYILPTLFACGMIITALQGDKNQRTTMFVVGIGGAVLFSNFAAGLVLFFVVSMFAGIASAYIAKRWQSS